MTSAAAKGNSVRAVSSNQTGVHKQLEPIVRKHLLSEFRKPIAAHNRQAFERARSWLAAQGRPLILDSFCGTGESTAWLGARYPDHAVIGIDKSRARLERHPQAGDNCLFVRADTDDFWRLARDAGWRPRRHCLFYPNPWPKSEHLKRRCHGSPLFPTLLALGGELELRSNWRVYAEEFCAALAVARIAAMVEDFTADQTLTAFERKYAGAGQKLWVLRCEL